MPPPSKIMRMEEADREWLNGELVRRGFGDLEAVTAILQERGYDVSRATVGRHSLALKEKLELARITMEQAKAIVEATGDDADTMGEALVTLVQQKAFDVLMKLNEEDVEGVTLPQLMKGVSEINRAQVQTKKWRAEVRTKIEARMAELEKEAAAPTGKRRIDPETLRIIQEEVYGIVS